MNLSVVYITIMLVLINFLNIKTKKDIFQVILGTNKLNKTNINDVVDI